MYVKVNYNNINSLLSINILLQKKHYLFIAGLTWPMHMLPNMTSRDWFTGLTKSTIIIFTMKMLALCQANTHMHTKTHIHTKEMKFFFFKHSPGILRFHTIKTISSNLVLGSVLRTLFKSVFLIIENLVPSFRVISFNSASAKTLWALQLFIWCVCGSDKTK